MEEIEVLKKKVKEVEFDGEITRDALELYINYADYAIFKLKEYEYGRELAKDTIDKIYQTIDSLEWDDIWQFEREYGKDNYIVQGFYRCCLIRSFWDLESYIFFMEQDRPQDKRFYLSRKDPLNIVVNDIEDLANRKIKFLGISLPSRTGKSTTAIFGLSWLAMKRPNSHSAMGGHSGVLTKGFYKELMNLFDSAEYRFGQIYQYWHGEGKIIQDKSAEDLTINLDKPDRFSTISCRSIDSTWTGAVDVSWDGWLYVDDLVRDREHSLSPTRMENTWQEYLNKMVDRKSGFNPEGVDLGFDIDISFDFDGACELMIGTLWNVYDPLYRMELLHGDDPLFRFRKIPALNDNDETNFPYQYTTEYLHEMRERLDDAEWMAKWQQSPYVREGILINKNEMNYFTTITEPINRIIGVLDPAVGGGDYLSMVVLAEGKKKYIIDWVYSRETKGKTIPEIVAKVMAHGITEIHYERNGIGRVFDDDITKALHNAGYYGCKVTSFTAPEGGKGSRGLTKEEIIIGYSDWIKQNLWFIDETAKNTQYTRSGEYSLALSHVNIYTTVGKNKWDDAIDNLAQVARMYEKQRNGIVDVIMNPFRGI